MTLRRRRVTSRGFRPERRRENRTPSPRKSDLSLSLYNESGKTPSGRKVARNARNRTKTLSHIQPSASKAYVSNERTFAARNEALRRAFKSSRVHLPSRFPTFKAQIRAIFSQREETRISRAKLKKSKSMRRRKDATVQSAMRRAHRIAKYQYRIQKQKHRERERRMCVCAPGTACFFSNKSFCGFYEENDSSFLEKIGFRKRSTFGQNWALYE